MLFSFRVKFPAKYKVPAHWHPVIEHIPVISGTLNLGAGDTLTRKKPQRCRRGVLIMDLKPITSHRPKRKTSMHIRVGYELIYHCPQATPMILLVNIHYSRASDIVIPDYLTTEPSVPITAYRDPFGNWCNRIVAPAGQIRFTSRGVVRDSGQPDVVVPSAPQHAVEDLPEETLVFLRGSRYCETDLLSQVAWDLFEKAPPGWARVQAICDYVHTPHHVRL